jgi:CheY-like chemotaxis protein
VNWMLVERLLANRGHSAANAINGQQVIELFESDSYDLVLMDCQMPLVDGYAAARARYASGGRPAGAATFRSSR